ncbi:MAG: recombinase family protein [Alphaproteobacteria bacterium]|nr:recombinase family protein [Alphaproteobacteria bacterium]
MSGKTIGYIRVSSYDQNPDRQLDGIHLDKVFVDKASGKDIKRPAFEDLLNYVREGDLVMVHSLDRLARNLDHLRSVVKELTTKGIQVKFLKENLVFTGDDSPMSNLLLSVMGAFAEFERSFIKERQMEGIALAKLRGAFKGRRKTLNAEQVEALKKRVGEGDKKSQIARDFKISRETLYQYLKC